MKLISASATHIGLVRCENQDRFLMSPEIGLFAVADGMGGLDAGGLASELAIRALAQEEPPRVRSATDKAILAVKKYFRGTMAGADRTIAAHAEERSGRDSMGTTLVSVLVSPGGYFVANVGDSRAYLVRSGEIKCLTRDHSYVQELINEGRLPREAAQLDPRRNVISRYLGGGKNAILDFFYGSVQQGDIFLLTSDGVTMHLDDKDLLAQVAVTPDPLVLVDTIIERAIEEGGEDNATVVAVRMEELDSHQGKARTLLRRTVKDR